MLALSLLLGAAALVSASIHEARAGHVHQRSTGLCGGRGYDLGQEAYFYTTNSSLVAAAACGAECVAEWQCRTFAVGNGACLLYTALIGQNSRADDSSPYVFYDFSCVAAQSLLTQITATPTAKSSGTAYPSGTVAAAVTTSAVTSAVTSATKSGGSSGSSSVTALAASTSSATATATSAISGSSSSSFTSTASASSSTKSSAAWSLQSNTNLGVALGAACGAIQFINMCL